MPASCRMQAEEQEIQADFGPSTLAVSRRLWNIGIFTSDPHHAHYSIHFLDTNYGESECFHRS